MAKAQISAEKIKETREAGGKRMLTVKQGLAARARRMASTKR